ncbi:DUF4248 domain-containing protein [Prevotella sp. AM34-19LB]|uniref:DUF4248 domain-containing protein n=1 Tax=Prevotella sp. AM34-19LB TaxID=2292364 RepID=UPI001F26EC9B|nr:DUF4248 domain-containing protein [Prevotella sp. AM34-19LB]
MEQKCYSKQELALEYFPDATPEVASAHLRRWINRCKPLHDVLVKSGYTKWSKEFSPIQVAISSTIWASHRKKFILPGLSSEKDVKISEKP